MDGSHMSNYGQLYKFVFCERKCNFRLTLMYYKSFLFPPSSSSALATLLANPALSSILLPLHLMKHNMPTLPSLLAISAVVIPVSPMTRISPAEVELLKWINDCTTEWWKYKRGACTTIDWRQFAKQYLYWTQLSSQLVFMDFSLWSPAQLQQKLRDFKKLTINIVNKLLL
jgi:hypothetical protein